MTYQEYMSLLQTKVIDILNKGINPWQPADRARNGITDRKYNGANALMLNCSSLLFHNGDMRWYTINQANKIDSHVRKGEKATPAYFFQNTIEKPKKDEDGNVIKDENGLIVYESQKIPPVFKVYYVFNAQQLDPIPRVKDAKVDDTYDRELAESILSNTPVKINYENIRIPFYSQPDDEITLPLRPSFPDLTEFYSTAFHEMAHSTGAISRLARNMGGAFGSEQYAIEELVAEITALSICESCDMKYTHTSSADYIGSWLHAIESPDFKLSSIYSSVSKAARFLEHPEDRARLISQARNNEDEILLFNGEKYLHVQRSDSDDEPWDYTIYDKDMKDLDGGRFGTDGMKTSDAIDGISQYHNLDPSIWKRVDFSIMDKEAVPEAIETKPEDTPSADINESTTELDVHSSPVVRFTFSENYRVPIKKDMSIAEADKLLASLNDDTKKFGDTIKTNFVISFQLDGKEESCKGQYIIGRDSEDLVEHVSKVANYFLDNQKLQNAVKEKRGEEEFARILEEKQRTVDKYVPALSCHKDLDDQKERTEGLLDTLQNKRMTTVEREFIEYSKAILDWVDEQRSNLNKGRLVDMLNPPKLEDFQYIMPENADAIKTVYISGPITSDPNYVENFKKAEESLSKAGYKAINPVELVKGKIPENMSAAETWRRAMEIDLEALRHSDAVVILDKKGLDSMGMDIETHLATRLDIPLVTLDHILTWNKQEEKKADVPAKMKPQNRRTL